MRRAHNVVIKVFITPEEDAAALRAGFLRLAHFDLGAEKIAVNETRAKGFNERTITILTLTLTKEHHTNAWIDWFTSQLSDAQRKLLLLQKESRLDEQSHFFIRLDKNAWNEGRIIITDSGQCYHIEIAIAAYPSGRENAMKAVETILYPEGRSE